MAKKIVFISIIFLAFHSNAQTLEEPMFIVSSGISIQNIKSKSFSQFQENYINYYGNNIKKNRIYSRYWGLFSNKCCPLFKHRIQRS
jgi:hypothetical protein